MRGLAELQAENDALVERARKRESDSIKRLKQRIARVLGSPVLGTPVPSYVRRDVNRVISEWAAKERSRR